MPRIPTGQPRGPKPRGVQAATERITVRFSQREMSAICAAAKYCGQTVALYVADCAMLRANELAEREAAAGR